MSLSESELKKYVIAHPQDEEAFQHFLSITRVKPGRAITATNEQFEAEIRKRINLRKMTNQEKALYAAEIFLKHKYKNKKYWLVESMTVEQTYVGEPPGNSVQQYLQEFEQVGRETISVFHPGIKYSAEDAYLIAKGLESGSGNN